MQCPSDGASAHPDLSLRKRKADWDEPDPAVPESWAPPCLTPVLPHTCQVHHGRSIVEFCAHEVPQIPLLLLEGPKRQY